MSDKSTDSQSDILSDKPAPSSSERFPKILPKELDSNWQTTKSTVRERNAAMLNSQLMTDVKFIIGEPENSKAFLAHKYVLAMSSPVFFAMFNGPLAESKQEIMIPDIDPEEFLTFLKYLYSDEVEFKEDEVVQLLYVAHKYMVTHLENLCIDYLKDNVRADNAFLYLKQSLLYEKHDLKQLCWEIIGFETEIALNSSSFLDIDLTVLKSVLSLETLNCEEVYLFEAAKAWAQVECLRREMDPTSVNIRAVLDNALNLIRFPTMAHEEFANCVAEQGILTQQEIIDIFMHFSAVSKQLPFSIELRKSPKLLICSRFINNKGIYTDYHMYNNLSSQTSPSIIFFVNVRVYVVGVGIFYDDSKKDTNVKIELQESEEVIAVAESQKNKPLLFQDEDSSKYILRIPFPNVVRIRPNCMYTVRVAYEYICKYLGCGQKDNSNGSVKFSFKTDSANESNISPYVTDVDEGQIPEIIYYY